METKFYQNNENTTDVWITPLSLINALGEFDLDPACPNDLAWKTAHKYYSLENNENGLELPWFGRIWLNSPYSNWVPFHKKLSEHNNGISLLFAKTETKGFFDYVWDKADSILFLKRRVKFLRKDGSLGGGATAPSVLIAYGKNNTDALEKSRLEGKLIKLK